MKNSDQQYTFLVNPKHFPSKAYSATSTRQEIPRLQITRQLSLFPIDSCTEIIVDHNIKSEEDLRQILANYMKCNVESIRLI